MNSRKIAFWGMVLIVGGIFVLGKVPVIRAEVEEVPVINREPDESDPLYEMDELEGGVFFRVPKGTTFIKQDGVISPVSSEEYYATEITKLEDAVGELNAQVDALAGKSAPASGEGSQESL